MESSSGGEQQPGLLEWQAELERVVERRDQRQAFLWAAFIPMATAAVILAPDAAALFLDDSRTAWWATAAALSVYLLWLRNIPTGLYAAAQPAHKHGLSTFQILMLQQFVKKHGAPRAGRLLQVAPTAAYVLASVSLWKLLPFTTWPIRVVMWVFLVNYAFSAVAAMLPFFAPRKFLAKHLGKGAAVIQAMGQGLTRRQADADPRIQELRSAEAGSPPAGWAKLIRLLDFMSWFIKLGLRLAPLLHVVLILSVFATMPAPSEGWNPGTVEGLLRTAATVLLGLWSIFLLLRLYIDHSRGMLEQLHHLVFLRAISVVEVHKAYEIIEAFRTNHYVLRKSIPDMLSDLGANRFDLDNP